MQDDGFREAAQPQVNEDLHYTSPELMIETEEVCAPKAASMEVSAKMEALLALWGSEYAFNTENDVVWRYGSRCEHRAYKSTVCLAWPTPRANSPRGSYEYLVESRFPS